MEISTENEHNVLREVLNEEEYAQIPPNVAQKVQALFNDKFEEYITAKAVFETNRKNLEQKLEDLKKQFDDQKLDLQECKGKLELAEKYSSELETNLDKAKSEINKLQESVKRLEKENGELRRQRDTASDERDSLQLQVERRDSEIEIMRTELASIGNQLQTAVGAKCQALAEAEEIRSREMTLDFKEKRLEQERVLVSQQMASLEEELAKRTSELQTTRAEASARAVFVETKLAQCEEDLRIEKETTAHLRESNATFQRRCEELAQKIEEQRTHEISMHASYQEEIGAQKRLADIFKGMADDSNAKAEEFSNAVKELQELLKDATDQYGTLETNYNQLLAQNKQEIEEKQQKIEELAKELEHANELLMNIKQERLEQAVEQLAPTAAIASRILKKGMSLTQIYTQLVEKENELALTNEENEKLKSQMEVILHELEEKAPVLQQQREDYKNAVANVATLSAKLDEFTAENQRLQESMSEAERIAGHHTKENQRLKNELADLARQVCYLLKEVQESRRGNVIHSHDVSITEDTADLASSQIISKKLVTFRDIEELQENNQKLLSIVRTLSSRQEEMERATDEINSGELKEKLERIQEQLADMETARNRQIKMVESLVKQRDMYKNMYQQTLKRSTSSDSKDSSNEKDEMETDENEKSMKEEKAKETPESPEKDKEWEKKLSELEAKLKQVTDEYETYRKDKVAHEKMLGEEIDRLRKEAEANSTRCCRLKAQLDSASERFHLLQANVASYKSQIKSLEEKCSNYSTTIGKHEQSIMFLKDEAMSAQSRLSSAEVQLENLRQERQLLRDSEGRLLKEREIYQRERQTLSLLRADVESMKASMERTEAEGKLRAEQRLDDATRECAALRRRLQEEQDRFRELAPHLEKQLAAAQERLKEERAVSERLQEDLEKARQTEAEYAQRIEELNSKYRQAAADSLAKPITGDENLAKRLKELEMQLASSQAEVRSLTEQLKVARQQSQQYCDIAENAETQLAEATAQYNRYKEELENNLKEARAEVVNLQNKVKELGEELTKVSSGKQETDSELRERLTDAEKKLEELEEIKNELEIVKAELQNASITAKEAEEKYAREMVLHSADLQTLAKYKEEAQLVEQKLATLTQERNTAVETLKAESVAYKEREKRLQEELQECQKRIDDLDTQNSFLHNQIQELGDRVSIMQSQSKISDDDAPNTSLEAMNRSFTSLEDDSRSAEQLLNVMKFLRREKDLAVAKFDVLRAENLRLKSQVEVAEKRLKETEALLNSEREKTEIDVATASKHAELLRKVETLNAITDSNRILREERDALSAKVSELIAKVAELSEEVVPLRDTSRDLQAKTDALMQENTSLKGEATRWRQRANALVERANKASPEDWRRLQTERENLSKLLTSERETHAKRTEELNQLKSEKAKLDAQLELLKKQVQSQNEQATKATEETRKLSQELNEAVADSTAKTKEVTALKKELTDKEVVLNDLKNKEMQVRKIAKKYKTQYEELVKSVEEEKNKTEETRASTANAPSEEVAQVSQEREDQLREEGRQEMRQANVELTSKIDELTRQMTTVQTEAENLKKEIETMNKTSVEKEERAKQVLKGARTKIMQLADSKKACEKELLDLKAKIESGSGDSDSSEHDARIVALKSQMEGRISRLEHEKSEVQAEKEALLQRVTQLQRQLAGVSGVSATTEPPTANIKPMSARAETPLASIRPMSVVVQSRTAAVLPTTANAPVMVAPHQLQQSQQQVVHTTETSSPTSSLTDFQPASTSSSQTAPSTLRQLVVQPQLNESAESTQREDSETVETLNVQQQQCQQQQQQQQQQTVALVSPRVEQQQQQQLQQQAAGSDQQQTVASSSTQSVSTSQASTGHKRPRTLDSTASGSGIVEGMEHNRQEQLPSPKAKRSRQQEMTPTASASVSDVEYQVPTSSQRDQDEEVEEGIVVVDCDEGEGGGNNQAQEEEEFDNEGYDEMEEEEELPYEEVEVERDNNEVEIIMEEDSTSVEVPRQAQAAIPANQQQQQSEAISSAGPTGEPPTSFASRSSRGIAPMPRQQQQQHLLLPQQGYEDGGDDSIVPSTPTLFVPRRGDGFAEAVSSPQVPQGRFTFGDPSASGSSTSVASLATPAGPASRTMFGSSVPGVTPVGQEVIDDTRIDLAQLEDAGTGRSVPTTPLQVSPAADLPPSTSSGPSEEQEIPLSVPGASATTASDSSEEPVIPNIRVINADGQEHVGAEIITESSATTQNEGVSSEGEKRAEESSAPPPDDAVDTGMEVVEETAGDIAEEDTEEESREAEASPSSNTRQRAAAAVAAAAGNNSGTRGTPVARRSARTPYRTARGSRPTPIVWGEGQSAGRGQSPGRGHSARGGANNEGGPRGRGTRGRRIRSKYAFSRF